MVTFKDILNRAYTTLVTDYNLDNLKKMNEEAFYTFLSGFLVNSIDMFDGCINDLSYHEIMIPIVEEDSEEELETSDLEDAEDTPTEVEYRTEYVFDNELTSKEIFILSLGVAIGWYKKTLDDVTQFRIHLSEKNFKAFSEANNLQRRLDRLNVMQEDFDKEINKYQLSNLNSLPFFGG